jgi:hypothetical protein
VDLIRPVVLWISSALLHQINASLLQLTIVLNRIIFGKKKLGHSPCALLGMGLPLFNYYDLYIEKISTVDEYMLSLSIFVSVFRNFCKLS